MNNENDELDHQESLSPSKWRCSVGTVSNRLKLVQQKTCSDPSRLRRLYQT
jgi:hypothetical protein